MRNTIPIPQSAIRNHPKFEAPHHSSRDACPEEPGHSPEALPVRDSPGGPRRYRGVTDAPTLCSFTNHAYWNLNGHAGGEVLDHTLQVPVDFQTLREEEY